MGIRLQVSLSRGASAEVGEVVDSQACGNLSQACAAGGDESAQQAAILQFFEPGSAVLGAGAEPIEDAREQRLEAGAARAAQRCRMIVHEAPVQKSRRKPTPLWRGGL
jgi:hypothetical protein